MVTAASSGCGEENLEGLLWVRKYFFAYPGVNLHNKEVYSDLC